MSAYFAYEDQDGSGLHFSWQGGEYIDISTDRDRPPFDCINVWSYEAGCPRIPLTLDAFEAECRSYISDSDSG